MFLKRSMVLAAGVLLFVISFIIYFDVCHSQMEDRFRAEREKFHSDNLVLTAPAPVSTAPAVAPQNAPSPSSDTTPDTNTLIGPVPPTGPATPENPTPSTNAPDPNAAPLPPAPSTRYDPRDNASPFFVRTSYRPSDESSALVADNTITGSLTTPTAPAVVAPDTNSPAPAPVATPAPTTNVVEPAPSPAPATNAAAPATPVAQPAATHSGAVEGSVIILLYHQFKAPGVAIPAKFQWTLNQDVFASEMKYIHDNGYHVVSLADVVRFLKHQITLPPGSVCITIDDGYKSAIVYAAPILKQYGYPWTFYIYPEFITDAEGPGAASWKDLLDLQAQGVDIESHSMTHPILTKHEQKIKGVWHNLSPTEYDQWLTNETAGAKAVLEQKMGKPITSFAYPFGAYNKEVEAKAIAAGYESILTVAGNPVHSTTSLDSIGRYTITQSEVKNFESDLRQGALGLADPEPSPGATITNPRPVISAVLGYQGALDPKSIETSVYDFDVRHDFDPVTNAIRLYLPRDLIQPVVTVNIRVKDAKSGQTMVARWHFNYEPVGGAIPPHPPISATPHPAAAPAKSPTPAVTAAPSTNAPAAAVESPRWKKRPRVRRWPRLLPGQPTNPSLFPVRECG
jgi:peptidoglycan/xylan/chitin deacetylase (PgdA/CDA1 family)